MSEREWIRILHVDDEPNFLELTKDILEMENKNFSVDTVTSAEEGLELLKENKHDVAVSDYKMPGRDGLQFLQNLRQSGNQIPFIMFTGKGREEVAMEALNRGASHYLQKGGDVKSLYGTLAHAIKEVVKKKRAEDRLAEVEKERQIILDSVPAMIFYKFYKDRDSNFIYVNTLFADACGMNPEDFIGKSTREIFPAEAEGYIKTDREVVESGIPKTGMIEEFLTHEGKIWVRTDKIPIKDADGNVTGILGFSVDITEKKHAEEALLESEEKYRGIVSNAVEGIYQSTLDGEMLEANPAFLNFFGYETEEEFKEINAYRLFVNPEDRKNFLKELEEKGEVRGYEIEYKRKDGKVGIGNEFARLIEKDGRKVIEGIIHDTTEQRQAEETLREAEKRYKAIFDNRLQMVYVHNEQGIFLDANDYALERLGHTRNDLGKVSIQDILHQEDIPKVFEGVADVRAKGFMEHPDELRLVTKSGEIIWVETFGIPLERGVDHYIGLGMAYDITERKKMEEKMIRLSDAVRMSIESIVISDREAKIIEVNEATLKMYGTDNRADLIGKSSFDLIAPEDREKAFAAAEEVMEKGCVKDREYHVVIKDGSKVPVEMSVSIMKGGDDEPIGFVGVISDITERKRAEEALRKSEAKYLDLYENANDIIFTIDLQGRFTSANKAAYTSFGYQKDEVSKLALSDVLLPEDAKLAWERFQKMVASKSNLTEEQPGEYKAVRKDGSILDIEVRSRLLMENGQIVGSQGIARDITERKRAEEALEHRILALTQPVGELSGLKLADIIDVDILQKLQDDFARCHDVASIILDQNGEIITEASNLSEFCSILRSTAKGREKCMRSDARLGKMTAEGSPAITTCQNFKQILDGAVPIYIKGQFLGSWCIGQMLTESLDVEEVRRYAKEIEADEDKLVQAAEKLKVGSKDELEKIVAFLDVLAKNLSLLGLQNLQQARYITERKRAEEEIRSYALAVKEARDGLEKKVEERTKKLRESENKYRILFEHTGTAMWISEDDTTISLVNEEMEALSGYSREELEGKKSWTEFVHPDDRERVKKYHELRRKGEKSPTNYELKFIDREGDVKNIYITVGLIPGTEKSISSLIDITELKQMEEKIVRSERLATIGEFSSGVAHELRQPLGVISNAAYFLGMKLKEVADEKVLQHLGILEKEVKRANRMINDLLEFARVPMPAKQKCEVTQIVEEALSSVDIPSNIEVKKELKSIPTIHADFDQIQRVCTNIIANAISVMPEGGSLGIKTEENKEKEEGNIEISISDTGEGIPRENVEKIFEPLFTTRPSGFGLGLSLCKKYVEAHGGRIEVESEVGKGSTFIVRLPVSE